MPDLATLELRIKSLEAVAASKALGDLANQAGKAESAAAGTERGFERLNRTAFSLERSFSNLARRLGPLLTTFFAFSQIKSGVTAIEEFEVALAQVRGIAVPLSDTLDQQRIKFEALSKAARDLGTSTRFTATEVAQAELNLAKAGFSTQQIITALPAVLTLAAGGALELSRAAEIAGDTLHQFGLSADQTTRVSDVIIKVANSASTSVDQMAEALKYVGPVAHTFKISLEEASAAISVLSNAGIKGSLGGTTLRGIIVALAKPTKAAAQELDILAARIGVTREAFDTTKHSLIDIFEAFKKSGAGAKEFLQIFGIRQVSGATAIASMTDDLKTYTKAGNEAMGTSKRLADLQNNTLFGSFKMMAEAVQAMWLSLGDAGLLGALKSVVDFMRTVFQILAGMNEKMNEGATAAHAVASAIRFIAVALGTLLALKATAWLVSLVTALFNVKAAFLALGTAIKTNPLGVLLSAIALVVAACDTLGVTFADMGNSIIDAMKWTVNKITAFWMSFFDFIWVPLKALGKAFSSFADFDFKHPIDSAIMVKDAFAKLGDIPSMVSGEWKKNFEKDWFGEAFPDANQFHFKGKTSGHAVGEGIIDGLNDQKPKVKSAAEELADEMANAVKDVDTFLANLRDEAKNAGLTTEQLKEVKRIEDFKKLLKAAYSETADDQKKAFDKLGELLDILDEIARKEADVLKGKEAATALKNFDELVEKTQHYYDLLGQTEKASKAAEARTLLTKAFGTEQAEINKRMEDFLALLEKIDKKEAFEKLRDQAKNAAKDFDELLKRLAEENELIGRTDKGKEIVRAHRLAVKAFGNDQAVVNAKMAEFLKLMKEQEDAEFLSKITFTLENIKALSRDMAESFTSAFKSFVFGERSAGEALADFAKNLTSVLFDRLVAQPLTEVLTRQLTSALGGVTGAIGLDAAAITAGTTFSTAVDVAGLTFTTGVATAGASLVASATTAASIMAASAGAKAGGGLFDSLLGASSGGGSFYGSPYNDYFMGGPLPSVPEFGPGNIPSVPSIPGFADGGVMTQSRTEFMSGGRRGVFGEAGPELGFFPLDRGPSGKLGIKSSGGSGHTTVNNTTVSMVVKAEDPNAFRASQGQMISDARRRARFGRR